MQQIAINDNGRDSPKSTHAKKAKLAQLKAELVRLDPALEEAVLVSADEKQEAQKEYATSCFTEGWLHELWSPRPSDHGAAMGWALSEASQRHGAVLWVTSQLLVREQGMPYGPGLRTLGLDPARLVLVRTRDQRDSFWAIEEGIKSGAFAAVIGEVNGMDLASSRRLSLAAQAYHGCCLLLVRSTAEPQSVAYSRWRINAEESLPAQLQPAAPGKARLKASLVKHRGGMRPSHSLLEWQDATHRFHMVTQVADRPLVPGATGKAANERASA